MTKRVCDTCGTTERVTVAPHMGKVLCDGCFMAALVRGEERAAQRPGFNAVAQVSALPDEDGFLIRVWPPNGTHEHGGSNMTCASLVIRFGPDLKPIIEMVQVYSDGP